MARIRLARFSTSALFLGLVALIACSTLDRAEKIGVNSQALTTYTINVTYPVSRSIVDTTVGAARLSSRLAPLRHEE